jgi:hypothetical protein
MYPQHVDERWRHLDEGSEGCKEVVGQTLTERPFGQLSRVDEILGQRSRTDGKLNRCIELTQDHTRLGIVSSLGVALNQIQHNLTGDLASL